MCRWFAYISPTEPCLLEDVLITPKHALVKQVAEHYLPKLISHDPKDISKDHMITARNTLYNIDGIGIAWYTNAHASFESPTFASSEGGQIEDLRPAMYKTVQPPLNDINFRSICANTETRVCFAHIRAASSTAITNVNNHPFVFGRHTFMHNGVVSDFQSIQRQLSRKLSNATFFNVHGSTDSEYVAALYMTHLTNGGDKSSFEKEYTRQEMINAMHAAVKDVIELQKQELGSQARPNSLNLCVTDGIKVVAYRFRNHATQQPPSLYYSTKAGTTLNRKYPGQPDGEDTSGKTARRSVEEHGKHMIIASEPSTYVEADWELIGKNQLVVAGPRGLEVQDIPYVKDWDAVDPTA
ncbi:hypothetical protein AMS68_007915 [Peltaster fructicola]|uniref:Glutamine amidotransferase type-2 domain-containing protein n=1 Tax=Peltaster fructicola TaxID=286661 RepID=A0A6H0Y6B4_9PEZI|nr:hypothetical protein AMS68_007915 [Peltaster fructicola]